MAIILALSSLVYACGSSSSDDGVGYVKFYNASSNSPDIIFTVDENLETSETDEVEITYNALGYGEVLSYAQYSASDYFYELAWQDGDSSERSELEVIEQGDLFVEKDLMHFVVIDGDIQSPSINVYQYPIIDDEDDDTYDLFNLRVLNTQDVAVDVYYSKPDETFNEAILFDTASYQALAENQKLEQGSYVIYLTESGMTDVVFESEEIAFSYSAQYLLAIRENPSSSLSPFIVDRISNSSSTALADVNAEAQLSIYNAVTPNTDLLPDYNGAIDIYLDDTESEPLIESLNYGNTSVAKTIENGDFSLGVKASDADLFLMKNHLISLPENSVKTVFLFSDEEYVDDDNDGDVDEDGDGQVDEIELNIHSLAVEHSLLSGLYSQQITMINLVDDQLYSAVTAYFVRANETISNAENKISAGFADTSSVTLNNNTYQVYIVARESSSEVILSDFELTLDESSTNLFLVIEQNDNAPTGFKATLLPQTSSEE